MNTPQKDLLGTKTAYVPDIEENTKSFFAHYQPENDTFDPALNNVQVGFRPSWVLQARELTEMQSTFKNQFRLLAEGDRINLSAPESISNGSGISDSWIDKAKFPCVYEMTDDFGFVPQDGSTHDVVNKYTSVYGSVVEGGNPFFCNGTLPAFLNISAAFEQTTIDATKRRKRKL